MLSECPWVPLGYNEGIGGNIVYDPGCALGGSTSPSLGQKNCYFNLSCGALVSSAQPAHKGPVMHFKRKRLLQRLPFLCCDLFFALKLEVRGLCPSGGCRMHELTITFQFHFLNFLNQQKQNQESDQLEFMFLINADGKDTLAHFILQSIAPLYVHWKVLLQDVLDTSGDMVAVTYFDAS